MREIILHGELAELVGADRLELAVESPGEAVRALVLQVPGARDVFAGADWRVLEGERELDWIALGVRSQRGRRIEFVPELSGAASSKGKSTGKIVGGVLLLLAGVLLGPLGLPLLGIIPELTAAGAFFIGGLGAALAVSGISALLAPTPTMDYMQPEPADARQSALFQGVSNLTGSGHPLPLVYGRVRTGSVTASSRIVTSDLSAGGYLISAARLQIVDVLSEGEISGLTSGDETSILIDDTRVAEESGTVNFRDVAWSIAPGAAGDPEAVSGVETIYPVSTEIKNETGDETGRLAGAVSRTIENPDAESARVTIRIPQIYAIVPPYTGSITATPCTIAIEIASGGGSFSGAQVIGGDVDANYTTAYDTPIDSGSDTSVGFEYLIAPNFLGDPGSPVTFRFSYREVGAGAWEEIVVTRQTAPHPTQSGYWQIVAQDGDSTSVSLLFVFLTVRVISPMPRTPMEWKYSCDEATPASGGPGFYSDLDILATSHLHTISGIATSPYEKDIVARNLAAHGPAPWTIRISKIQLDYSDPGVAINAAWWDRYAEVIERAFLYPDAARLLLEVDAEDVGNRIPVRLYELDGILLELPSNLTPSTRTYSGIWDGTFSGARAWYDNPAWVLWDVMRSARYGLGLAESELDKWSFYDAAVYCDELVDDGQGGTAPRFTFNHTFAVREDALRLAQEIASAMQCRLWAASGKVFLVQDRPRPVSAIFNNSNVLDGLFVYGSPARSTRTTVAKVSWRNPDLGFDADVDLVDRPWAIDRYGENEVDVLAVGCTSRAQARRRGRWEVLTSELEGATIRFGVGARDAMLEPGAIIETTDTYRKATRYGGRIETPGTSSVMLDRGFDELMTGSTITILLDDGSLHVSTITSLLGGGGPDLGDRNFTLDTPVPAPRSILVGAPWLITVGEPMLWRALSIRPLGGNTFEVEAVAHDPEKQSRVEDFADLGEPLGFPTSPTPSAPNILTKTAIYDAARDLWSIRVTVAHTHAAAWWVLVGAVGVGVAISREATSHTPDATLELSTHAIVGGFTFNLSAVSVTADGIGYSTADSDSITIPAVVP